MMEINQQIGAKMPIAETIYQILWNGLDPLEGFEKLEKHLY
jgi:glycerol-3-phosphate dehydrogenase (NAD(P)+)